MSETPDVVDLREPTGHADAVDLQLRPVPEDHARPPAAPLRRHGGVIVAAFVLVALGLAAWWWWQRARVTPTTPAASSSIPSAPVATAPKARPLPPLDGMDAFVRSLLGALATSPELVRWLATDDLVRQMALAIDRVATGAALPKTMLRPVRPAGDVVVTGRIGAQQIDAESYRRFDGLVAAITAADANRVAAAYTTIRPRLDEAYRALGRGPHVDVAVSAALQTLIETPALSLPVKVRPGAGLTYAYADAQLEALPPAQKLILRMGPDHATRVTAKLREIKQAIETTQHR